MAKPTILLLIITLRIFSLLNATHQQQQDDYSTATTTSLNSAESNSVYLALESINPDTPWRELYPDDLCLSSPHGVVCSYFPTNATATSTEILTPHVTELNFGYVSDASPNPTCSPRATFPISLSSLPRLRKVLFYRCFTHSPVQFPSLVDFVSGSCSRSELEEVVFMENPSLTGMISGSFRNFTQLRRLILTGSNVSGGIPEEITDLPSLEQLTISGNKNLGKGIPVNLGNLTKLKILDLSGNNLVGNIQESLGQIRNLIKLDLSCNNLSGKIPESLKNLQGLEFLDLGYNKLGNYGVPMFLGEMGSLKVVYLSGNLLGGVIPEIWGNLRGILGIGLSGVGLIGNIPGSMGVFLRNASYIGLDNNELNGSVPKEFGLLERVNEVNLRNNQLSGRIPFSVQFASRVGSKLKVEGNFGLCIDKSMRWSVEKIGSGLRNLQNCNSTFNEVSGSALEFNASGSLLVVGRGWGILVILIWVVVVLTDV